MEQDSKKPVTKSKWFWPVMIIVFLVIVAAGYYLFSHYEYYWKQYDTACQTDTDCKLISCACELLSVNVNVQATDLPKKCEIRPFHCPPDNSVYQAICQQNQCVKVK